MANYVSSVLRMKGIGRITGLYTADDEGKAQFDFNKIIPMPEELDLEAGSYESDAIEAVVREVCDKTYLGRSYYCGDSINGRNARLKKYEAQEAKKKQLLEDGLKYIANAVRYGATSWYDWRIANWGTKWNAGETKIIDDDTVRFRTAWKPPKPIFRELSRMHPELDLEIVWADEDCGSNAGYMNLLDGTGEAVEYDCCSQEAFEAYAECWDDTDEMLERVDGIWQRKGDRNDVKKEKNCQRACGKKKAGGGLRGIGSVNRTCGGHSFACRTT